MNAVAAGLLAIGTGTVSRPSVSSALKSIWVPSAVLTCAFDTKSGWPSVSSAKFVYFAVKMAARSEHPRHLADGDLLARFAAAAGGRGLKLREFVAGFFTLRVTVAGIDEDVGGPA